jgi:tape measure domain-containing protein
MAGAEGFETGTRKNRAQMVAQIGAVAKDTVAGLLNGLDSEDAKVQAAARSLGESLIASMKAVLGIASPSKEFEKIGKNVGEGFEKGALSSMDNAFDALENKMRQRGKILDTVARGIFRMLGMDPAAMLQQAREQRATPVRTPIAGLLPSFTSRGTREETIRQLTGGGPSVAQGPGMLALSNEALGRRVSAILQEYFKVAEVQVRESFDPRELKHSLNVFSYIAQSLRDAESRTKQARVAESVDSLMRAIDNAVKIAQARVRVSRVQVAELGPRAQGALSAGRVAGLLPAATGRTPSPYSTSRVGGETQAELFARREREARMRSLFGSESQLMLPPARPRQLGAPPLYQAPSLPSSGESAYLGGRTGSSVRTRTPGGFIGGGIPSGGGPEATAFVNASKNALAYSQALGRLRESLKGVQAGQLPLVGSIKELAGEFGQATKQVLLYGTAYKALAFLTSLPGEAFNAAKALGTYKNQLQAVTAETGTFNTSLAFVDGLAQRFNVPLESARQGFVKLYASMQPAGFNQEQIEGLFTGISQSAAAFGLSADKVDRVNYAFAQMASKGQIMSEELKGQLGDVLPGALALFAEAAKMSIPEFSKAMEDGRFKGDAMVQVLENVGILMKVKFGAAAEGAAKTLQGALNGIQNNLKLMYEALGPVVNRMAAVFGPSVTSLIKSATDVIKAFELGVSTTGDSFEAMSPRAQGFYSSIQNILPSIKSLVPSFIAAAKNVGFFVSSLATASQPLLGLLKLALDFISIPFVARVGVYATIIGVLTSAFTLLKNTGIIQATIAMIRFIATLTVGQVQAWIASIQAAIAALVTMARTANIAKLSLMALKVTLVSFGAGAVLLGLDFVAQRLLNIGSAADDAKKRAAELTDELARAVETGNVALASAKYVEKETLAQSLGKGKQLLGRFEGGFQQGASMTKQEYQQLQRAGLATGIDFNERKGMATATSGQVAENLRTAQAGYVEALNASGSAQEALRDAMQVQGNMRRELDASRSQMKDIPAATGAEGESDAARRKDKQTYVSDMAKLLQQEMQQKINKINQDSSIVDREREIQAAATRYDYELLINKAEYNAGINDENKKDILNRGQYLEDLKKTFDSENELSRQRYEDVVTSPLRSMLDEDKKAIIDLEGTLKMLSEGRSESTNVEIRQTQIKQALIGLDEDQIKVLQPLIDLILQTAAARDKLTEAEKRNRAFTTKMTELNNQLTLAQIIDPRAERRERIRQETGFAPEQVEAQALLEERVEAAKKAKADLENIASSISNAFGEAFKGIITGSSSVREALAGMFQSIADSFADMVAQMIAEWLKAQLIQGFLNILGAAIPGGGAVLNGGSSAAFGINTPDMEKYAPLGFAKGGIALGGFQAFADGGVVSGPTLGLVGEGRYNEAIIPLPDGKSVPVDLGGAMGGMGGEISTNIVINVNNGQMQSEGGGNASSLGRKMEGAVKQVIVNELRPGGVLAGRR